MKLGVFGSASRTFPALVDGDQALDLTGYANISNDLTELLTSTASERAALASFAKGRKGIALQELRRELPFAPKKLICIGLNYFKHAQEANLPVPDYPAIFMRTATSIVAAEKELVWPKESDTFDYECELMIVIGKGGRRIPEAEALDRVFGYTAFNDGSIRAYQRKSPLWTAGKNFDATGSVGPVVMTADELPAGAAGLRIRTLLNGAVMQDSNTEDLIWPVARLLTILSEYTTLEPGDLIATGTPSGVGAARKPPVWMRAGDTVEVLIDGIPALRNPVVAEAA